MHLRLADYVLWLVAPTIQLAVLILIFRRKLNRYYQWFFAYTFLQVLSVPFLAATIRWSYTFYYYAYYVNVALSMFVSMGVVWEVFKYSFGPRLRIWFATLLAVLCLTAVLWAINAMGAGSRATYGIYDDVMLLADRSLRVSQVAIVLVLSILSVRLGVSRRSFLFGVRLGFGFFAGCNMFVTAVATHHGILSSIALSRINSLAYLASCIIWVFYAKFGTPDAKGIWRSPEPYPPDDSEHGPNEPPRWFFRIGLSHGGATARA
jgi:hypothetical protein